MSLADFSDDEIIAETARRLTAGRFGFHGLMSEDQSNYRDMWCALYLHVRHCANDDFEKWNPIAIKMGELVDDHPRIRVFALATTHIGREAEYQ